MSSEKKKKEVYWISWVNLSDLSTLTTGLESCSSILDWTNATSYIIPKTQNFTDASNDPFLSAQSSTRLIEPYVFLKSPENKDHLVNISSGTLMSSRLVIDWLSESKKSLGILINPLISLNSAVSSIQNNLCAPVRALEEAFAPIRELSTKINEWYAPIRGNMADMLSKWQFETFFNRKDTQINPSGYEILLPVVKKTEADERFDKLSQRVEFLEKALSVNKSKDKTEFQLVILEVLSTYFPKEQLKLGHKKRDLIFDELSWDVFLNGEHLWIISPNTKEHALFKALYSSKSESSDLWQTVPYSELKEVMGAGKIEKTTKSYCHDVKYRLPTKLKNFIRPAGEGYIIRIDLS